MTGVLMAIPIFTMPCPMVRAEDPKKARNDSSKSAQGPLPALLECPYLGHSGRLCCFLKADIPSAVWQLLVAPEADGLPLVRNDWKQTLEVTQLTRRRWNMQILQHGIVDLLDD